MGGTGVFTRIMKPPEIELPSRVVDKKRAGLG